MAKEKYTVIGDIPQDIIDAFQAVPDKQHGCCIEWTPLMDAIILKYAESKTYEAIAQIITAKIKRVSEKAVAKRYRELGKGKC